MQTVYDKQDRRGQIMALVKMKDLLRRAEEKNIGCGAFSVGNMEMVRGAIRAAEELDTRSSFRSRRCV